MGMMQGAREGLKLARRAFISGEPIDARSKVEAANYRAIPGKVGDIIRLPTRALTAEDEFFKEVARRGEINAQAWRIAHAQKLTASERQARYRSEERRVGQECVSTGRTRWSQNH